MSEGLRIGMGYDVHAFEEGRPLMIGGIEIPFEKGLKGHSDADVLIHAIVDSILGALGAGDIGQYFSPNDERWKNASSVDFLKFTKNMADERGAKILSIDSVLMLERPKIGPHREAIRRKLADILELDFSRLHLKATTTEKLGFTGREEGIAAQAVCLLDLAGAKT
jgi:2-C-methyl-D-erythritol 4-phosphate cytidylyltransferase/2-C-methyl-D-erythritol 2,4-cyclodiphosphate synthase